mmetsp:Transcript_16375/g.31056  ORF Transcript_16375/g.31056 Transcript_16375/m.31056 type:complete len:214 (+) Transcript_16375:195-836(+)
MKAYRGPCHFPRLKHAEPMPRSRINEDSLVLFQKWAPQDARVFRCFGWKRYGHVFEPLLFLQPHYFRLFSRIFLSFLLLPLPFLAQLQGFLLLLELRLLLPRRALRAVELDMVAEVLRRVYAGAVEPFRFFDERVLQRSGHRSVGLRRPVEPLFVLPRLANLLHPDLNGLLHPHVCPCLAETHHRGALEVVVRLERQFFAPTRIHPHRRQQYA